MCTWKTSTSAAQRTSSCNEFSRRLLTHTHTALDLTRACTFYSNCDHSLRYTARCWWKITLFLTPYVLYFLIIFVVPAVKVVLTINLPSTRSRNVKEILPSYLGVLIRFFDAFVFSWYRPNGTYIADGCSLAASVFHDVQTASATCH